MLVTKVTAAIHGTGSPLSAEALRSKVDVDDYGDAGPVTGPEVYGALAHINTLL